MPFVGISVSTDITEIDYQCADSASLATLGGLWRRLTDSIGGDYHTNVNIGGAAAIPVLLSGGYVAISAFPRVVFS